MFSGSCAVQTSTSVLRAGDTLGTPMANHLEQGSPRSGRLCAHRNAGLRSEVSLPTLTEGCPGAVHPLLGELLFLRIGHQEATHGRDLTG